MCRGWGGVGTLRDSASIVSPAGGGCCVVGVAGVATSRPLAIFTLLVLARGEALETVCVHCAAVAAAPSQPVHVLEERRQAAPSSLFVR